VLKDYSRVEHESNKIPFFKYTVYQRLTLSVINFAIGVGFNFFLICSQETAAQFFYDMNAPMEDKSNKRGRKGEGRDFAKRPKPTFDQGN